MSAAVTRAEKLEHRTDELAKPARTCVSENPEAPPVIEVTRITGTYLVAISNHGMTPLMRAACDGLAGTVQALLDRGAEVDAKRSDGFNALALAAFFGHSQVVWLLLENGADLAATGRCETTPEMWADARGFFDIADTLREARVTEQVEVASLSATSNDESARFSRPAENENLQRAGDPSTGTEAAAIDEVTDSQAALAMRRVPVVEESIARRIESPADIIQVDKPQHRHEQPVIKQQLRASKTLPEIEDPPPLAVPRFNPGSVFVTRITSSWKNLAALILAVLLVCSFIAVFLFPQIPKSLGERRIEAVSNTTNLPTRPSNPAAGSGTNVSGTLETTSAPATQATNAPASKDIEENAPDSTTDSKRVESTSQVDPAEVSEKGSTDNAANRGSESRAHPSSGTTVPDASEDKRDSAAMSVSRSGTRTRNQRAVSRVKFKQQTVAEEQPKPAPLSVETSRSRSVLATPAGSANEAPSSQPAPLSIISGKPKSKVIQWP